MKKIALIALTVLLPTSVFAGASETVNTIGKGLQLGGSASNTPLGAPIAALGSILSIGADLFSLNGIPTDDQRLLKAAEKWQKAKSVVESQTVVQLKQASDGNSKSVSSAIARAKEEAATGRFTTGNKLSYITLMNRYDKGEWITVGYPLDAENNGLLLWCNKSSDNCILGGAKEHIDLPTFTENAKNLKKSLNGSVVTLGDFEAYEPKLAKLGCGVLGSVMPFRSTGSFTFVEAIKKGLMKEIVDASGYAVDAQVKIIGKLTKLDISVLRPEWNFGLELTSSNGKSMKVTEQYKFDFEFWSNDNKCDQLAKAYGPAVQYLVEEIVKKPEFAQLLSPIAVSANP
jgi:hypothetical protein